MTLYIEIKVMPSSGRQKWVLEESGPIKCYLKSPPTQGKANAELIKFIASTLKISQSLVSISFGGSCRNKLVKIDTDITQEQFISAMKVENDTKDKRH